MIFGGDRVKSVELYNWKTGKQCYYGEIPFEVATFAATVLDGVPVYCGGGDTVCKKYDADAESQRSILDGHFFTLICCKKLYC